MPYHTVHDCRAVQHPLALPCCMQAGTCESPDPHGFVSAVQPSVTNQSWRCWGQALHSSEGCRRTCMHVHITAGTHGTDFEDLGGRRAHLLELCGGVCVLPVVRIIVSSLVPQRCIYLNVHLYLPLTIIWRQPLQHKAEPVLANVPKVTSLHSNTRRGLLSASYTCSPSKASQGLHTESSTGEWRDQSCSIAIGGKLSRQGRGKVMVESKHYMDQSMHKSGNK